VPRHSLNWDDVRTFLALARNQKLGVAAKSLGINATTLSRRIQRLSQSSNSTLFEMHSGEWLLTEAGEKLLSLAERAESAMLDIEETEPHEDMLGFVRVAISESFGIWFLSERIKAFHDAYPNIIVELISPSWYFSPLKREVDMAILPTPPQRGPLTTRRLADMSLRLFASRSYLESHPPIETIADLSQHRLVGFSRNIISKAQLDHWRKILPNSVTNIRMSGIAMQTHAVAHGAGIGLLPSFIGTYDDRLLPVLRQDVTIKQSFWLAVREDVRHSRRIEVFVKWLVKQVQADRAFFRDEAD
jgi:DNA-binding transcriptional LysR family regulator